MNIMNEKVSINVSEYYHLEWPEWMRHLKGYGFRTMEIAINCVREPEKISQLKELIKENNITISSVHDWFHFFSTNTPEGIKEMQERLLMDLEYTRILDSDRLIWYTGGNNKYEGEAAVDELLKRIEPVIKRAAELKITLLLETEFVKDGFDPSASVQMLKKLFIKADSPYFACNFDAANMYAAGEEPFPYAYEELKPWIRYVHMKDIRELVAGIHSPENMKGYLQEGLKTCACCALGEGGVNMAGILNALKRDNYNGYLSLELHMKEKYLDETLEASLDFIKRYWYS